LFRSGKSLKCPVWWEEWEVNGAAVFSRRSGAYHSRACLNNIHPILCYLMLSTMSRYYIRSLLSISYNLYVYIVISLL
jgi:hypothetical protein